MRPTPQPASGEIDLKLVFLTLRKSAPWIAAFVLLVFLGVRALSERQPASYQAISSVIAVQTDGLNPVITSTLVHAPPLPQGAVEEVVHSRKIVERIEEILARSVLAPELVASIQADLYRELAENRFARLSVIAKVDAQQRGVYEIRSTAETPLAARVLADAAVAALLEWDGQRALAGLRRARASLQAELKVLTAQVQDAPVGSLDRETLLGARTVVLQRLSQVTVLEKAAEGSLSLVRSANEPRNPLSPRPVRDGAMGGLVALLVACVVALAVQNARRPVTEADHLVPYGFPVLGQLPLSARPRRAQTTGLTTHYHQVYESMRFLRVNLLSQLERGKKYRLVVTSARPREGKSFLTALIARALAERGMRVLIVDADPHRPSQSELWGAEQAHPETEAAWPLSSGQPGGQDAVRVAPGVDLLNLESVDFGATSGSDLERQADQYDVVLFDTPPLLIHSDSLVLAENTDGLLLVVDSRQARAGDLERVLQNTVIANVKVIGFILNKVSGNRTSYRSYRESLRELSALESHVGQPSGLAGK